MVIANYGDYFVEGLRQELCAIESRKCIQKVINNQISIFAFFIYPNWKKNAYITKIIVYCSVKCLFCFNSMGRLSVVYCQMDLNSLTISNTCRLFEIAFIR